MPIKSFRFEFCSVHGHVGDKPVNYVDLVRILADLAGRHEETGNYHVAISRSQLTAGQLFLVVYTGYSDRNALFFDFLANAETTSVIPAGRFQARKTHALLDANKRLLGIEVRRGTLSATALADLIQNYTQKIKGFENLEITFNPIADRDFAERLDQFRRIQAATITIGRPNVDWTDRHDQLTQVASESDAGTLDVTAHARRGRSLSKDHGLIEFIRTGASSARSMFKKIRIVGSINDQDSGLIILNLSKHVEHVNIPLEVDPVKGVPSEADVREKLSSYMNEMKAVDGER